MSQRICICALLLFSTASLAFCQQPSASPAAATPALISPRSSERRLDDSAVAEAKLQKILPGVLEFDDDPLDLVVDTISEAIDYPIALDRIAIEGFIDVEGAGDEGLVDTLHCA